MQRYARNNLIITVNKWIKKLKIEFGIRIKII